jgi:hypothetical protein
VITKPPAYNLALSILLWKIFSVSLFLIRSGVMNMLFSAIRDTRKAYIILIVKLNLNRKLGRHRRGEVYKY